MFTQIERSSDLRIRSGHLLADRELVVRVDVGSGWVERCVRGTKRPGERTLVEVLPHSCTDDRS